MKALFLTILACLNFLVTFAQSNNGIEMAEGLRSSGKIYVVVIVLLIIFLGFIIYLFTIDRRIGRLEKNTKEQSKNRDIKN